MNGSLNRSLGFDISGQNLVVIGQPIGSHITRLNKLIPDGVVRMLDHGIEIYTTGYHIDKANALAAEGITQLNPDGLVTRRFHKVTLMPHQVYTVRQFLAHDRMWCLNDLGTGKTICVLALIVLLLEKKFIDRVFIFCPLTAVETTWAAEIQNVCPQVTYTIVDKIGPALASRATLCLLNHDKLKQGFGNRFDFRRNMAGWMPNQIAEACKAENILVVFDECDVVLNGDTQLFKALHTLVTLTNNKFIPMTGTPCPTRGYDVYHLAKLVAPGSVPAQFAAFKRWFKDIPEAEAARIVYKTLRPAVRFEKRQCIPVPPLQHGTVRIPLNDTQLKMMRTLRSRYAADYKGKEITATNAAVLLMRLIQIGAGGLYTKAGEFIDLAPASRLQALYDILHSTDRAVLIYAYYRGAQRIVEAFLRKNNISVGVITGATDKKDRRTIVEAVQAGQIKACILAPKAASHALTLTAANIVVQYHPHPFARLVTQGIGRVERYGQQYAMRAIKIMAENDYGVEAEFYSLVDNRTRFQERVLALFKQIIAEDPAK